MHKLLTEFKKLRKKKEQFISVMNSEWYSLFKDEIRNSIVIEGVFANRNELLDVLEKNKRTGDEKTAAILGYFESAGTSYEYANNLYKNNEFRIRLADIKQIHTLLMRYEQQAGTFNGVLGDFRNEDVAVTQSSFTPLKADFLNRTMTNYVKWMNQKIEGGKEDPLKLFAASHILFETIHPFRDGNGRVGRILLSFLMIGLGYANITIKGTAKAHREKYYYALETGDDVFEKMLRKIEKGQSISPQQINDFMNKSNFEFMETMIKEGLKNSLLRLKSKEMIKYDSAALLPLRDAAKYFDYSQDYLRNLINKGNLSAQKKGKLWYVQVRDLRDYINSISK